MTKILVQPDLLRNLGQQFVHMQSELDHIGSSLQSSLHNLQWELHHAQDVMELFNVAQQTLQQCNHYLQEANSKLVHTADSFAEADGQSTSSINMSGVSGASNGATYSLPYVHGTNNATYFPSQSTQHLTSTFTHNTNSSAVSNPSWASGLFSGLAGIGSVLTQGISNAVHAGQSAMNAVGDFASHVNWGDIGTGATTIAGGIAETASGLAVITGSGLLEAISAGTATPVTIATGVSGGLMMGDGLSKVFGGATTVYHSNDADRQKAEGTGLSGFLNAAGGLLESFLSSSKSSAKK